MTPKFSLDDQSVKQLLAQGELSAEESHGVEVVIMTVDTRQQLHKLEYADGEPSPDELTSVMANALKDKEDWGHPDMDVYDTEYGHLFDDNGEAK